MIRDDLFTVEPWGLCEPSLDLEPLAQAESIFALSNGHIGLRGTLEEGEPSGVPGTYLNGFYEVRPLPHAEVAYGDPEASQTMINVTDGKVMRLLVDDEPFDVRYGRLVRHERRLDLRDGVLRREAEWVSPAGQGVLVRSTRLVSFAQRAVAAILYEVSPLGEGARIVVQSELVANEPVPAVPGDPRASAALRDALAGEEHRHDGLRAGLIHRARASGLRVAAAMDHVVSGPAHTVCAIESEDDLARLSVTTELEPGQVLRLVKFVAYGWSSQRTLPALRDQVDAALASARHTGWDGLMRAQRAFLDDAWDRADVELEGDPALQQATRLAIWHVLQSAARAEGRGIPAKGLTGSGYDGHSFWDMDTYTLPVLTYVAPGAARDALAWRHAILDLAQERARVLGLRGAAFPWRTIRGQECSGYWPAGTAGFHVNADIADAVRRYVEATGDDEFARGPGLELLVETARLWSSLGHHDATGRFRIDGVTGPDEYSALADNNTYTNLMAARNMLVAASLASRFGDEAARLGVGDAEILSWREAADAVVVPFDDELGVTQQAEGFTRLRPWNFADTCRDERPLLLNHHNYLLYSSQVIKQADLVFALYACGERFSDEQKARDFEYYERITVRDSSLSAAIQAIVAAEVGQLDLASTYMAETAFIDLRDMAMNTRDGIHLASAAGTWLVAVAGFGGMRDVGDVLAFAPQLPPGLTRLRFRLMYRGRRLRVDVRPDGVSYELLSGDALEIAHCGERVTVPGGSALELPLHATDGSEVVSQPEGRVPPRSHREA